MAEIIGRYRTVRLRHLINLCNIKLTSNRLLNEELILMATASEVWGTFFLGLRTFRLVSGMGGTLTQGCD